MRVRTASSGSGLSPASVNCSSRLLSIMPSDVLRNRCFCRTTGSSSGIMTPEYDALRAMGERGWRASVATLLAKAVYAQGRFDQALLLTEEAAECAAPDDFDAQARWRAVRAKVLARCGQFRAAAMLAEEAVASIPAASGAWELAEFLVAQAEVLQLAGALDQAETSLRRALRIYENRRITPLADQTRALLARLAEQRSARKP